MAAAISEISVRDISGDERAASCALAGLPGIGGQSFGIIRSAFGSLGAAVSRGGAAIAQTEGLRGDGVEALRAAPDLVKRGEWLVQKARELGARVLVREDADYPALLRQVPSSPPVLYILGHWPEGRRVAVVGTRTPDEYGRDRTRAAVDQLCGAGVEVVSGGAEGVDTEAHEQTLARGGRTVAIVGSGLLHPYPRSNAKLFDRIAKHGALVTEFAHDSSGNPTHFPQRNRTMAGACEAVVITRGGAGSGALTTCQSASRFGRPVFAVPGQVGDALSVAPNSLLSTGTARALVTGAEVLDALGLTGSTPVEATPGPAPRAMEVSHLPQSVRLVFDTLGPAPRHVDDIAEAAGVPTSEALTALLRLELDGLCVTRPGKFFVRR